MDPIVGTVLGIVSPYLAQGAEEFARSAGAAAIDGVKALVARLAKWWTHEPVAEAAAKALPKNPERYARVLGEQLADELERHPGFADELHKLVDDVGPAITVIQKIEIARGVTGADIRTLVNGSVHVVQEVRDAQNLTGFKADKVGGC